MHTYGTTKGPAQRVNKFCFCICIFDLSVTLINNSCFCPRWPKQWPRCYFSEIAACLPHNPLHTTLLHFQKGNKSLGLLLTIFIYLKVSFIAITARNKFTSRYHQVITVYWNWKFHANHNVTGCLPNTDTEFNNSLNFYF